MENLYTLKGAVFSYRMGTVEVPALKGVDLQIPRGSFECLTGPSGSGKSTLLALMGLIENPQDGSVVFEGRELGGLSEKEKNQIRRHRIGFVFQSFHLFDVLDAAENTEYFLQKMGLPAAERAARVEESLRAVGLWEHRHQRPLEMSGGQRQRVAIARALAKRPSVILADEPTASLDQATGREILGIFRRLHAESGVTVLVSSHDAMVMSHFPRLLKMQDGRLADAA
jgi:ABC-type lipoprotein export system ATPase subunit